MLHFLFITKKLHHVRKIQTVQVAYTTIFVMSIMTIVINWYDCMKRIDYGRKIWSSMPFFIKANESIAWMMNIEPVLNFWTKDFDRIRIQILRNSSFFEKTGRYRFEKFQIATRVNTSSIITEYRHFLVAIKHNFSHILTNSIKLSILRKRFSKSAWYVTSTFSTNDL